MDPTGEGAGVATEEAVAVELQASQKVRTVFDVVILITGVESVRRRIACVLGAGH